MSKKLPTQFLDELRSRIDIVDLIEAKLPLKKSGQGYVARCPFHNEKTPSFHVNRSKQFFHCFGCGVHGDAIGFLMQYDRLSFMEAVQSLAILAGLSVPQGVADQATVSDETAKIFRLQSEVADLYANNLAAHSSGAEARSYLESREVSKSTQERFKLGYAPTGSSLLRRYPESVLMASGLVAKRDDGEGLYERFRDRVMFPILDLKGRVVGFGGRAIGAKQPKYLNSPETVVFKKHRELYGLYEALQIRPRPSSLILVEGYMDVISLAQAGTIGAVASLGTAIGEGHVKQMFRYVNNVVVCLDGDLAGRSAAWRAVEAALPALSDGYQLKFAWLPDGEDPDSFVRKCGQAGIDRIISSSQPLSDFFFDYLKSRYDVESLEGRAALANTARPLLNQIPQGDFKSMMLARVHEFLGSVRRISNASRFDATRATVSKRESLSRPLAGRARPSLLHRLAALCVRRPDLVKAISVDDRMLLNDDEKFRGFFAGMFELVEMKLDTVDMATMVHELMVRQLHPELIRHVKALESEIIPGSEQADLTGVFAQLRRLQDRSRINALLKLAKSGAISQTEKHELQNLLMKR